MPAADTELIRWRHPILGTFVAHLDFEGGLKARAVLAARRIDLKAPGGVLITTPDPLPDLRVHAATIDFAAHTVRVQAEPTLGELEERLLSGLLRDALLLGRFSEELLLPDPGADVEVAVYDGKLVKAFLHSATDVTVAVTREELKLSLSQPIRLDFGKLLGQTPVHVLRWAFAEGRLRAELGERPRLWDKVVGSVLPAVAKATIRRMVPEPMLQPGYDPVDDPGLSRHLRALLLHVGGPGVELPALPPPAPPPPARLAAGEGRLELRRTPDAVELLAPGGLFFDTPARRWASHLQVRRVRWDERTEEVAVEASHPIGEAARSGLGRLVRERLVAPIRRFFGGLERDRRGCRRLPVEGGAVIAFPDGALTARLTGDTLVVDARPSVLVRGPFVFRYAVRRVRYHLPSGAVAAEVRGTNCLARLFGRRARTSIEVGLAGWLEGLVPDAVRTEGYDLFEDPSQRQTLQAWVERVRSGQP